ncbi:S8 family serine peptidase [bacterium]|nr:S8 family serine peptidase [bacterium]MCI0604334.1 S8 family serine peptidase [bacterium]
MKRTLFFVLFCVAWTLLASAGETKKLERIYDRDGDRIFENLRERMQKAKSHELLPVVILYREETPVAGTFAARLNHIRPEKIKYSYRNIPAVSLSMTASQIEVAKTDPWVKHIELDSRVKATMDTARDSFGVDAIKSQFGYTGNADGIKGNYSKNDIVVAVLDTGVADDHPDLKGKVLYWNDYVNGRSKPYDDNSHGTLVSGIVLGSGKGKKKYAGVAPQAALVSIKVLDSQGSGFISDVIAGIDEVIDRRVEFNIRVLNLSLAIPGSSAGDDATSEVANRAVSSGIVVVVAAGNDGPDSETIGSPSAATKVITVGAGSDLGERGFALAAFSSRGPTADGRTKPDLWGPGVRIHTTYYKGGGYRGFNGTSFSSPFVAGVVALMLEANPGLKPRRIKRILIRGAENWAPGAKNNEAGGGRLQAYDAITKAAAITEDLDPPDVPKVLFVKTSIDTNQTHSYTFNVTDIKHHIAITAVVYNFNISGTGLVMELVSPTNSVVATQNNFSRQEAITFKPLITGVYTIRVTGQGGFTPYLLDISADRD